MEDSVGLEPAEPLVEPTRTIPPFALPDATGSVIRSWQFRGRRNLVLVFSGLPTDRSIDLLLNDVADERQTLADEETAVIVVVAGGPGDAGAVQARLGTPFPVLADADGSVHRRYGATADHRPLPAVFVADRYGHLYARTLITRPAQVPAAREILDWVRFINLQCPE